MSTTEYLNEEFNSNHLYTSGDSNKMEHIRENFDYNMDNFLRSGEEESVSEEETVSEEDILLAAEQEQEQEQMQAELNAAIDEEVKILEEKKNPCLCFLKKHWKIVTIVVLIIILILMYRSKKKMKKMLKKMM